MDLDKLIASFQAAADASQAAAPMIDVETYIPSTKKRSKAVRAAARRFVGAFVAWLGSRRQLVAESLERWTSISGVKLLDLAVMELESHLGDRIENKDVDANAVAFVCQYCQPGPGSYGDDFHELFVAGTDSGSFLEVELTPGQLDQLFACIDSRFASHRLDDPHWKAPLQGIDAAAIRPVDEPAEAWNVDRWSLDLQSFDNLESAEEGRYQRRSAAYLAIIDQAEGRHTVAIAAQLVRTYVHHSDASLQSNVWRLLRPMPPLTALAGMLQHFDAVAERSEWATELVDLFDDDLDDDTIDQMADMLDASTQKVRLLYSIHLRRAEREGSRHATRLLASLNPAA